MFSECIPKERNLSQPAENLYSEYSGFLMSIFQRYLPKEDAQDVFQSFFLKLTIKGLPDDIDDVMAYLYQSAKNAISDHVRKEETYQKKIRESAEYNPLKTAEDPATKVMQFDLLKKTFMIAKKKLRPSFNQALVYKYQHHQDNHEIAKNMGVKKSTVGSYLSVGSKLIHGMYDDHFGEYDE